MAQQNNSQHQPNSFTTDEYVLAYHGPLLYEARVSDLQTSTSTTRSFCAWSGGGICGMSGGADMDADAAFLAPSRTG
jgi:hypothetical protein